MVMVYTDGLMIRICSLITGERENQVGKRHRIGPMCEAKALARTRHARHFNR